MLDLQEQIDIRERYVTEMIEQADPQVRASLHEFFGTLKEEDFFNEDSPFWHSFRLATDALTRHYLRGGYFILHSRAKALALTTHELLETWWPSLPSSVDFSMPPRLTEWHDHERFLEHMQIWFKWYTQLYLQPLKEIRTIMFTNFIARHKRLLLRPYYSLANDLNDFATYDRNPIVQSVKDWMDILNDNTVVQAAYESELK